ncbi:lytic transglycosylase domain-containing protein [Sphingomonas sp. SAFR-052]|uniref:lytic transglycosylase domain-containing protein n=1 Tax=Sphingomonas sp. SAFR-052 TaxID=3436867 RepID=UPI003F813198
MLEGELLFGPDALRRQPIDQCREGGERAEVVVVLAPSGRGEKKDLRELQRVIGVAYRPMVARARLRAGGLEQLPQEALMGLSQLMPATARALGVLNPFDARANVDGGARYLRAMLDRFGSINLALAAYNAGPGAVLRSRGVPANGETPAYVGKVLAAWSLGVVR